MKPKTFNIAPEIQTRKKSKKRKRKTKGSTVAGWEKLQGKRPLAPLAISGLGIVSGETINAAPEGAELAIEGGVKTLDSIAISGVTDSDSDEHLLAQKALPRIGRRIANNLQITGDKNPKTRIDANLNGLIFDGTWMEMPDPTPGNSVTGAMGFFDKFKKRKPALPKINKTPFMGIRQLINEQAQQLQTFEKWAAQKNWFEFHRQHFDWWTFPVDRGSAAYGFKYDVSGTPLKLLRQNPQYLKSLSRAAELYLRSLGWNLKKHDWDNNLDFNKGQDPVKNINSARLFKIGRSLQIHGLDDNFLSMREMVQSYRQYGYAVGEHDFWDAPDRYVMDESFSQNNISGAMAIATTAFDAPDGGKQRDPRKELKFIQIWANRDIEAKKYFSNGRGIFVGNLSKPPKVKDITWDWEKEELRQEYVKALFSKRLPSLFANYGDISMLGKTDRTGLSPALDDNFALLSRLGLAWGKTGKKHGGIYDQYGVVITHSATPSTDKQGAARAQVKDILSYYDKNKNPYQYWTRFESWIRSPLVEIKDPSTGKSVGVRLFFKNDRTKMEQEFDKRIKALYMAVHSYLDIDVDDKTDAINGLENSDYSQIQPYVMEKILDSFDKPDVQLAKDFDLASSIKHVNDIIKNKIIGFDGVDKLTPQQLTKILQDNRKNWVAGKLRTNPKFLDKQKLDELTFDEYKFNVELMEIAVIENKLKTGDSKPLTDTTLSSFLDETKKNYFPEEKYTTDVLTELYNKTNITGAMSIASSHIKTTDSENTTLEPKKSNKFINHVTSTPSAYISLQEPTSNLEEAIETGRPISWLIPGQLHPILNDAYNGLVKEIHAIGHDNGPGFASPEQWSLTPDKKDPAIEEQEIKIINKFANIKKRHEFILNALLSAIGMDNGEDRSIIATGLIERAASTAAQSVFLSKKYNSPEMTDETLKDLNSQVKKIFDRVDNGAEQSVVVTVPASKLEQIFKDGRLKTQHETLDSMGSYSPDVRRVQEVAMFSIHPRSKIRPIYGSVRRGTIDGTSESTDQYGAATIVLKNQVEKRSTWTESDSLSHQTSASTLSPGKTTWDGLYIQSLHQRTKDAYFVRQDIEARLREMGYENEINLSDWPYIEAQIHGGVSVNDISHIIIDENWYQDKPENVAPEYGPEFDENNWMDSPKWIQISEIAESLDIPLIMLRSGLDEYEVLEEPNN